MTSRSGAFAHLGIFQNFVLTAAMAIMYIVFQVVAASAADDMTNAVKYDARRDYGHAADAASRYVERTPDDGRAVAFLAAEQGLAGRRRVQVMSLKRALRLLVPEPSPVATSLLVVEDQLRQRSFRNAFTEADRILNPLGTGVVANPLYDEDRRTIHDILLRAAEGRIHEAAMMARVEAAYSAFGIPSWIAGCIEFADGRPASAHFYWERAIAKGEVTPVTATNSYPAVEYSALRLLLQQ